MYSWLRTCNYFLCFLAVALAEAGSGFAAALLALRFGSFPSFALAGGGGIEALSALSLLSWAKANPERGKA